MKFFTVVEGMPNQIGIGHALNKAAELMAIISRTGVYSAGPRSTNDCRRLLQGTAVLIIAFDADKDMCMGFARLARCRDDHKSHCAYIMRGIRPETRGTGLNTMLVNQLLRRGHMEGIGIVYSLARADNQASIRSSLRLGTKQVGYKPAARLINGEYIDEAVLMYDIRNGYHPPSEK